MLKIFTLLTLSSLVLTQNAISQKQARLEHPSEMAVENWLSNELSVTGKRINEGCRAGSRAVPQICLVTVDANSTHNVIYWDKTGMAEVDYFIIYRENGAGAYDSIGNTPYDSLSEYHDFTFTVHPNYGSSRYKISAVDTFGVEGPQSLFHQTIFCDEPAEGDFAWSDYQIEGAPSPVLNFIMLRNDTIGAPWLPIDTVPSTVTTFSDPSHASFPAGEWKVRTQWPITCTPTRAGISTSRSNLRNKSMLLSTPQGPLENNNFTIYPNPANDMIVVEFPMSNDKQNTIIIHDAAGRIVDQKTTIYNKVQFSLNAVAKGTYFVEAINSGGNTTKIFIKN